MHVCVCHANWMLNRVNDAKDKEVILLNANVLNNNTKLFLNSSEPILCLALIANVRLSITVLNNSKHFWTNLIPMPCSNPNETKWLEKKASGKNYIKWCSGIYSCEISIEWPFNVIAMYLFNYKLHLAARITNANAARHFTQLGRCTPNTVMKLIFTRTAVAIRCTGKKMRTILDLNHDRLMRVSARKMLLIINSATCNYAFPFVGGGRTMCVHRTHHCFESLIIEFNSAALSDLTIKAHERLLRFINRNGTGKKTTCNLFGFVYKTFFFSIRLSFEICPIYWSIVHIFQFLTSNRNMHAPSDSIGPIYTYRKRVFAERGKKSCRK